MEKKNLKKLTKGQLIKLLMNQRKKPIPPSRTGKWESVKPKPVLRKRVNEDTILPPPEQFRDGYKPIPKPRTDRLEEHITNVSVPKIKELNQALKGHAKSYVIELQDSSNPLNHFTKTKSHLEDLLKDVKGFKFIETLEVTFEKDAIDSKTGKRASIYKTAFFNGKAKIVTEVDDIEPELNMSRQEIMNAIDKWVSEGSGWVIDRIDSHHINVTLCKPLNGSSYIELPTELQNSAKRLINMKNKDDECFRWCHIRHSNPQIKYPERIKKEDKKMINELNHDGIDFPVSQKHYNKVEKQNSIRINVFGYEDGQPFPIHISKETFKDQMNLLLITKDKKKHYVLIKDFNAFMYNQTKHKERKHFCMYCLQCFSSERVLVKHANNCLTISGSQAINMPKQGENILKFNNFHKPLPVPFVIYADFEAVTKKVQGCEQSEEMKKNKDRKSYTEAYQTHEDCGYGYKVVCCYRERYSKPIQTYLGENAVYKFMEKMLEEAEYCKAVIKKRSNKPLVMTEDDEQRFRTMDGCHICGKKYTAKDVNGRILAPFMYKVYINSLLNVLSNHCYAIFISGLRLSCPSFADDISLITLHASFLQSLMTKCVRYSLQWRYEFNHTKSGVVTLGESKPSHLAAMQNRNRVLGDDNVDELYEYKNLGILKNYVGSFSSNIDDNIEKTQKKAGMIFSSNLDRRKINPLVYVKSWKQACLPSLLYGAEVFTLTPTLLTKLERCQSWFLKIIFYVPKFAPSSLLQRLSGLNSIESEIALRKLLFLGRLITEPKMAQSVRSLFMSRAESYFDASVTSMGVLPSIIEALNKYDLYNFFISWFHDSTFPTYSNWKCIVKTKVRNFEDNAWADYCVNHPGMHIAQACLRKVTPYQFWCLADNYPDLVSRMHIQIRLMGNFGLNGGVPWHVGTNRSLCLICKEGAEDVTHFLLECPFFKDNVDSVWLNIKTRITETNPLDGTQICNFISNLDGVSKVLLLLGGLPLPFDNATAILIKRFISSAVGKIFKLHTNKLRELEAPWLKDK